MTANKKQLLIESCEFVSKIKIPKKLKESVKLSNGKTGTLIVRNIPVTILNRENQNGRIYGTDVVQAAINEAQPLIESKQLLSQACEHPEGSYVSPTTASHVVIGAYIKNGINVTVDGKRGKYDVLFNDWEVLNTQEGKNLRALFEAECSIGTSIRGLGDLNGNQVIDYEYLGTDCVGNPSSSTFTRMPVSESVVVEIEDREPLTENFSVTTASTNVVSDLDKAAVIQAQLDDATYGTVVKTSTKLDSEVDPKTGATTSITTLEAETEDEVESLDQALQMAKNAMLNGLVNVDSVTIENIKEDEEDQPRKHEATEEYVPENEMNNSEQPLEEISDVQNAVSQQLVYSMDGRKIMNPSMEEMWTIANELRLHPTKDDMEWQRSYQSLVAHKAPQPITDYAQGKAMVAEGVDKVYDAITAIMTNDGLSLEQACRKFCEQHDNIPYEYVLEYMQSQPTKEAVNEADNVDQVALTRQLQAEWEKAMDFVLTIINKYENGEIAKDQPFYGTNYEELNMIANALRNNALPNVVGNEQAQAALADYDAWFEERLATPFRNAMGTQKQESQETMKEAKEKDPNEGKQFVLKAPNGYVSMEGNALTFKSDPKLALHFIVGKENTGLVHLSEVEKILDTMGVYDVQKYYKKSLEDISATPEEEQEQKEGLLGGDVNISTGDIASGNDVNISALPEANETLAEEGNTRFVAEIKSEGASGEQNAETVPVSAIDDDAILAEVGNLWQQKSKNGSESLIVTVKDTQTGAVYQYDPANNALVPQDPSMVTEADDGIEQDGETLKMTIDNGDQDPVEIERDFDSPVQATVAKAGIEQGKIDGSIMLNEKEGVEPGWYVGINGIGVSGPFESKEKALQGLEEYGDMVTVEYLGNDDELEEAGGGALLGGGLGGLVGGLPGAAIGGALGSMAQDYFSNKKRKPGWKSGALLGGALGSLGGPVGTAAGAAMGAGLQNILTGDKGTFGNMGKAAKKLGSSFKAGYDKFTDKNANQEPQQAADQATQQQVQGQNQEVQAQQAQVAQQQQAAQAQQAAEQQALAQQAAIQDQDMAQLQQTRVLQQVQTTQEKIEQALNQLQQLQAALQNTPLVSDNKPKQLRGKDGKFKRAESVDEASEMDEVLYTGDQPASDPVVNEPLKDAVRDVTVTLKDIDWDIDSIIDASNSIEDTEAEDEYDLSMSPEEYAATSDENDFIGDDAENLYSLIQNLPNQITLNLSDVDLGGNVRQAKQAILRAANEQSAYRINNATIASIQ